MTRRRVVVMTEGELHSARHACQYVVDFAGVEFNSSTGPGAARAVRVLDMAPIRDVSRDVDALRNALGAIRMHCSCEPVTYDDAKHERGCQVQLHRGDIARIEGLIATLGGAP